MNLPMLRCEHDHLELSGDLKEALLTYCRELAAAGSAASKTEAKTMAPFQSASLAMMLRSWGRFAHDESATVAAATLAEATLTRLMEVHVGPHWIGGLTGITWTLRQLSVGEGVKDSGFSEAVDTGLSDLLSAAQWGNDYDLISGLVGYGMYGLEHPEPVWRAHLCQQVLRHLEALARPGSDGIAWFTPPVLLPAHQRKIYPNGYFNLGLAHGVPGVIAFLARCMQEDCYADRAEPLMMAATNWMMAQCERSTGADESGDVKPFFMNIADSRMGSRPLAWCYGDLGVGIALLRAADAAGSEEWRQFALEVACDCARRRESNSDVKDMGLCHGSAGAALIFLRFWQCFGDPLLADACRYWLRRTLEMRDPAYARTGGVFSIEGTIDRPRKLGRLDLLTGLAGVGLAMHSCIGVPTGRWDAPLLTDFAEAEGVWP